MEVKATSKFVHGSHNKFTRYCKLIRGKDAQEALDILDHLPSPLARTLYKTLASAVANADHNESTAVTELRVKSASADRGPGPMMKRIQPRARGRAFPILKHLSHVTVVVESKEKGS
jgi:large subunit ribosomal protein L22